MNKLDQDLEVEDKLASILLGKTVVSKKEKFQIFFVLGMISLVLAIFVVGFVQVILPRIAGLFK